MEAAWALTSVISCGAFRRPEYRGYLYKIPDFQIPGLASDNFTHLAQPSVGLVWRF